MNRFRRFLSSMLKVGCIGFGGGSALIPVIEREIIEKQGLDTKENYDKDVIVANLTPGALPVEIAASLGKRSFGRKGMVLGAMMMAFPGTLGALLLFTVLSTAQTAVMEGIKIISVGVSSFIIYLLIHYILQVLEICRQESNRRFLKALGTMAAVCILVSGQNFYRLLGIAHTPVFAVPTIHVLLAAFFFIFCTRSDYSAKRLIPAISLSGLYLLSNGKAQIIQNESFIYGLKLVMLIWAMLGALESIRRQQWKISTNWKKIFEDMWIWCVFLLLLVMPAVLVNEQSIAFIGEGLLSSLMSFGGGDAYLTIAHGLFVDSNILAEDVYYGQIVPVVNILPGSILCKTLTGIGYYVGMECVGTVFGGILFAVAGFVCSIAASCGCFFTIYHMYESLNSLDIVKTISRWIRPMVAGLLCNIMLSLCNQCHGAAEDFGVPFPLVICVMGGLAAVDYFWSRKKGVKAVWMLLVNICVGALVFFMGFI